jgi:hypothetical protein
MTTATSHPPTAPLSSAWSALPPEYAFPDHAPSEEEARAYCQRLARSHYENFSVASWFLPSGLRQHFFNVYAYCRISDDLGDEVGDAKASLQLLDEWETELGACYAGRARHPVFVALAETVHKFEIPKHEFADLLTAFRQDQTVGRYETFDDHWAIAGIRRIRWDTWCCISADIATQDASFFPITLARLCS